MGAQWLASGGDFAIVRVTLEGQRQAGADFASAWKLAVKLARREDRQALHETQGAWRAAYHGERFYSDGAIGHMAAIAVTDDDVKSRGTQRLIA
jgi:hypothetical protein